MGSYQILYVMSDFSQIGMILLFLDMFDVTENFENVTVNLCNF